MIRHRLTVSLYTAMGLVLAGGQARLVAQKAPAPARTKWAAPLAQDYVVVHRARDLKTQDKWVCVGSPDLLRLPSGRLIASMELWLATPTYGAEGGIDYPNHCLIKASDDGGKTWTQISTTGVTWGSLFHLKDALYLIGNNPHKRSIIITRSADDGRSWCKPATLFEDAHYHGSATAAAVKDGYIYRAFEDLDQGFASVVIAGDLSKDLLTPSAWRMSNKVQPPPHTPALSRGLSKRNGTTEPVPNAFLEGNVIDIRGQLYVLLRTRIDHHLTAGMTSVCRLEDNGREMNYKFVQFHPMIGGQNKFKIIRDDVSGLYWTCTAFVPDPYQDPAPLARRGFKGNPGNMRRILMLCYSIDGLNWLSAGCVAMSTNPMEAFHYSAQVIDGDDLLVLSRTSIGGQLPYNNHDTNAITFHRIKNFRSLALNLRPDIK